MLTGDVTHTGRAHEAMRFEIDFASLMHKMTVVPGNHDRQGEDYGVKLRQGRGVIWTDPRCPKGLHLVCMDSTTRANSVPFWAHGDLLPEQVEEAVRLVEGKPPQAFPIILLHHHLYRLPGDDIIDATSDKMGLPFTREISQGSILIKKIMGKCSLVLHGHRHIPRTLVVMNDLHKLALCNAGSTTSLRRFAIFEIDKGKVTGAQWYSV